ncbi:hypothetical protein FHS79_003342 [Polymorphobacter multimanifer]|uniref:Uncharacterized protein n=1 Tax=Polymorphobacter multimanifer TaxID=1070431 RepID=A0A841LBS7_9SPHN|nr:hypothetical protein [Polymorphobacter multimanifer]MBB6229141.1 hypothetical protein [Polymorphobacter multimanifer]
MLKIAIWSSLAAASASISQPVAAAQDVVAPSFADLKALVGVWQQADKPDSPLRIRFSLTAGGTAVVEEWLRGSQPHSMTIYHRDGKSLIATHYCPQGNQPRLAMLPPSAAKVLRFKFRDATDLDAARESYLVALAFDLSREGRIVRSETYRREGNNEASEMQLVREQQSGVKTERLSVFKVGVIGAMEIRHF